MGDDRFGWLSQPTRAKILAAAERQFASAGYAASSVDEVAASAGVSKSHLYYHFSSKASLLECLIEWRTAEVLRAKDLLLAEPFPELLASPGRMQQVIEAVLTGILAPRREFIRIALAEAIQNPDVIRPAFAAFEAVLGDSLARFSALGRPADEARVKRLWLYFGLLPALCAIAFDTDALGLPGKITDLAGDLALLDTAVIPSLYEVEP